MEAHLRRGDVEGFFSAVIAGDDGLSSKPAADVFRGSGASPARRSGEFTGA